jgi:peptidylprolyl isomerase
MAQRIWPLLAAPLLIGQAPAPKPPELPPVYNAADSIIANAAASDWIDIPADDIMVMETAAGTMAIQLAPQFAPAHVAAIKRLVREGRFDDGRIVRVQDNYVVQWTARPDPAAPPAPALPPEYERPAAGLSFTPSPYRDTYAEAGWVAGWPAARDGDNIWLAHCYATVGVGRDNPPDTGDGTELYAVIGHGPRHLDRNIANVGRVLAGIEAHAALPRGSEELGFYKDDAARIKVRRVRLASQISGFARWQMMDTASASFAAVVQARANRTGFFPRPAGAADLCNLRVPVRERR